MYFVGLIFKTTYRSNIKIAIYFTVAVIFGKSSLIVDKETIARDKFVRFSDLKSIMMRRLYCGMCYWFYLFPSFLFIYLIIYLLNSELYTL